MNTTIVPVAGNHEGNFQWFKFNNMFNIGEAENSSVITGCYYSFDWGDAHFAVLNENDLTSGGALSKQQSAWLKADLEGSDAEWNIILMGAISEDNTVLASQLEGIAKDGGADLIIEGNDSFTVIAEGGIYTKKIESSAASVFSAVTVNGDSVTVTAYAVNGADAEELASFTVSEGFTGDADLDGIITASELSGHKTKLHYGADADVKE
jgi:hypothetical protein